MIEEQSSGNPSTSQMAVNNGALVEETAATDLTAEDLRIIERVEPCLADARDLKRWWDLTDRDDSYAERFQLSATFNRPDKSFGFFDETQVGGSLLPIMGNVQEQFFDRPKTPVSRVPGKGMTEKLKRQDAQWMCDQIREFALRYFMRVSDFSQPQAFPDQEPEEGMAPYLKAVSWCPDGHKSIRGFGFSQLYFKDMHGEVGKFTPEEEFAVVDMREIGTKYEWIVLKVDIFNFQFNVAPLGQDQPFGTIPLTEKSYLVVSKDFILNQEAPYGSKDLGQFGLGYAFLPSDEENILAFGPGRFEAAFQVINFHVRENGEVVSRMAFVANRPKKVVNVSVDPMKWGMRMADMMSFGAASGLMGPMKNLMEKMPSAGGVDVVSAYINIANMFSQGAAARQLCISKKQLEKTFLAQHFQQHFNVVSGALVTWRQIPDWLERDALPDWVTSGISA